MHTPGKQRCMKNENKIIVERKKKNRKEAIVDIIGRSSGLILNDNDLHALIVRLEPKAIPS